jgi:hypothetical protein
MSSNYMQTDRYDRTALWALEAQIAVTLVEKWGLVAGDLADGEDSAGRARIRLQTPKELVARAMETAALLVSALETHGWIKPAPPEKPWRDTVAKPEPPKEAPA